MNRTGIDLKEWVIVYSPKDSDDVLLIDKTEEQIKEMSYKEIIELIKDKLKNLINN